MANIEFRRTSAVNPTGYNIVKEGLVIPGAYAIVEGEGLTLNNSVIRNKDGTYKPLLKSVKVFPAEIYFQNSLSSLPPR